MRKIFKLTAMLLCCAVLGSCAALRDAHELPSDTAAAPRVTEADEPSQTTVAEQDTAQTSESSTHISESTCVTEELPVTDAATEEIPPYEPSVGTHEPRALMYHLIREDVYGPYEKLFVRPSEFEAQLTYLDSEGYEYLFAEDWRLTEKPSVIITLDDGYDDNYTEMFPILKAHGARATVFLVTSLIDTDGYLTSDMIREMASSGLVSFQCHTANHVDLAHQSEEGVRREFDESCALIEGLSGKPVSAIAYPAGSYNDTVLAVAKEYFSFAYTTRSPNNTPEYTPLTVPRHYIARALPMTSFKAMVGY